MANIEHFRTLPANEQLTIYGESVAEYVASVEKVKKQVVILQAFLAGKLSANEARVWAAEVHK